MHHVDSAQHDAWSHLVARLACMVQPQIDATQVYDALGVAGLYVMSEEWWDPSVITLHPRMPVTPMPDLIRFRQRQLQRLMHLGIHVSYQWLPHSISSIDSVTLEAIHPDAVVGVCGMVNHPYVQIRHVSGSWHICHADGENHLLDEATIRTPYGLECMVVMPCVPLQVHPRTDAEWLHELLCGLPVFSFDTPKHPLRDWQVWHLGVDAFAVAALSAETAAPLAIVSDNVARIVDVYLWRIMWLSQQLVRLERANSAWSSTIATEACADALFYMALLQRQFPTTIARRSLSLAEGALIAEACRDTRQALQTVGESLGAFVR